MTLQALALSSVNVSTQQGGSTAITVIDNALNKVASERANLGALQNRLDYTIRNLGTAAENLAASESRVRDADMALEMTVFTRNQILIQAGTSMLAQANQKTQAVLQLLR
jgi:flagellin